MNNKSHARLMVLAESILLGLGFKEDAIHYEYDVDNLKIDVVGLGNAPIAVECGQVEQWKLEYLVSKFNKVIHLPLSYSRIVKVQPMSEANALQYVNQIPFEKVQLQLELKTSEMTSRKPRILVRKPLEPKTPSLEGTIIPSPQGPIKVKVIPKLEGRNVPTGGLHLTSDEVEWLKKVRYHKTTETVRIYSKFIEYARSHGINWSSLVNIALKRYFSDLCQVQEFGDSNGPQN